MTSFHRLVITVITNVTVCGGCGLSPPHAALTMLKESEQIDNDLLGDPKQLCTPLQQVLLSVGEH